MKKASMKRKIMVLSILMTFVATVLLIFGSDLLNSERTMHYSQLSSGWSVQCGDKIYKDVTLADFSVGDTYKGEVITIINTTPATNIIAPTIMFKNSLASVDVCIDGEPVYSYGKEYSDAGEFVPKKYNMIALEDGTVPHELSISYTIPEKNTFNGIYPIYFGTKRELVHNFLQYHRLTIFIGGFFFIYSCLLFALGVFMFLYKKTDLSTFLSALVSLQLGVYCYAYNDIFCFISDKNYYFSILEYIVLFFIPLAFSVLLYSSHPEIETTRQRIILAINILMPTCFILLHVLKLAHIEMFVIPTQFLGVVDIMVIMPSLIAGMIKKHNEKAKSDTYTGLEPGNYLLLGFVIIMVFGILEIIRYNISRFKGTFGGESIFANIDYLDLGMLFFIICLYIYYFLNGIDHMNAERVKAQLEGLAYTDALTGLANRAKCSQYHAAMENPYAVVSLDLDKLKYVNDTLGHLEGDKMIKAFADILRESFIGASIIGRTGGDEFLVIFDNPAADICDKCIRALEKNLAAFNQKGERFTLSASTGYAYSNELQGGSFEDIYYLADTRMYEMKEKHHA